MRRDFYEQMLYREAFTASRLGRFALAVVVLAGAVILGVLRAGR